jgi:hypothetical protein
MDRFSELESRTRARVACKRVFEQFWPKYVDAKGYSERKRVKQEIIAKALSAGRAIDPALTEETVWRSLGAFLTNRTRWPNATTTLSDASVAEVQARNIQSLPPTKSWLTNSPIAPLTQVLAPSNLEIARDRPPETDNLAEPPPCMVDERYVHVKLSREQLDLFDYWKRKYRYERDLGTFLNDSFEYFMRKRNVYSDYRAYLWGFKLPITSEETRVSGRVLGFMSRDTS